MAKGSKKSVQSKGFRGWKAKPGYKIFVADRGAVRFDFPAEWVFDPGTAGSPATFHDKQPPDDSCRLQMTLFRLPPGIDWTDLPLDRQLAEALAHGDPGHLSQGPIIGVDRPGLEIVWTEVRRIDEREQRESRSRHLLARGSNLQPFITLDFWPEDAERLEPVWDEVVRSLRLGQYVADPMHGPDR